MVQGVNTFAKGLHTDASILNQPEGTYRDALNITLLNDKGEYHALCNEKGTADHVTLPNGYNVIGHTLVDDEVVLCLVDSTNNYSQLGVVKDGTYTQKVPVSGEDNDLAFDINYPVDIVGRKLFNGDTIVYFTDNNEPVSVINLEDPPTDIAKGKNIIPDINLATITVDEIVTGGNLKGGVVQFMVRYLNKELVPTITTPPTNPLPILGSGLFPTDLSEVFGADYEDEVNKAVKLNISNLDNDYPYYELIAIEYEGATSAPKAVISGTYPITQTSIIYGGETEDSILTTVDEVIADPITYDNARAIEQKDGRLFLSNLTETKSKYRDELQNIANNITINYATSTRADDYYADELVCMNNKTYRRGEVYSFGIGVVFKDGTTSYVYHIPGADKGTNSPNIYAANPTTKQLGTYISEEKYPLNQSYPAEYGNNTNIRHHVMPTLQQEPHFVNDTNVITLSLDFILGVSLSTELKNDIQEIVLYREPRNSKEKRRKLAQGFATNIYMGASEYIERVSNTKRSTGDVNRVGDADNNSFHFRKNLGFFNGQINSHFYMPDYATASESKTNAANSELSTHHGFYYSVKTLNETLEGIAGTTNGFDNPTEDKYQQLNWRMTTDKFCFMSPETLLADGAFLSINNTQGAILRKVAELSNIADAAAGILPAKYDSINNKHFIAVNASFNVEYNAQIFNSFYTVGTEEGYIQTSEYVNNGSRLKLDGLSTYDFDNTYGGKFLYLKLDNTIQQSTSTVGNILNTATVYKYPVFDPLHIRANVGEKQVDNGTSGIWNALVDLFEIENNLNNQYGRIETSQYVPIYREKDVNTTTFSSITSGDTFITRYTLVNKNVFSRYFPFEKIRASNNIEYFQAEFDEDYETRIFTKTKIYKSSYSPKVIPGDCHAMSMTYFVESDINTYFRYRIGDDVPYYPNSPLSEVFAALPNQEDNRNYNVQYSLDNTLKTTYVTRPVFDEALTRYPNRTIYSERSNEDSKVDEYQIFKQNNFYDLPEDTGEIIDTFVWNEELYSHTPKALWRNFVNTVTREANTIGDVVLGTGGLFQLPSKKMITSDGGYGGSISQWGNAITPFGYFFVDLLQRKVFKLTNTLEEVSLQGMQQYFDENLVVPTDAGEYRDNTFTPVNAEGITMGWDNEYKRLLLTQRGKTFDEFTISYSPVIQAWISLHSYKPNLYIAEDKNIYSIVNEDVSTSLYHQHNVGDYGVYHNAAIQPATVDIVSNKAPVQQKVFDNFNIHSRAYDNTTFDEFDTFNLMQSSNDYQDSGELNIVTDNSFDPTVLNNEVLCRWKSSHFQVYIPRDNQETNLNTLDGWQEASRLKSKYLKTKFTYNNLQNRELVVNFIEYFFRPIAR
jgi:hypothetical protein